MKISGTFLDEISYDIPHQNWGVDDWDKDFVAMKSIGIDTVILIRCGLEKWITYPSKVLIEKENCHKPPVDLVDMFLAVAEKHGMSLFFGTYDSPGYAQRKEYQKETDLNKLVIDEVWQRYGHRKAFKGWYLTREISRRTQGALDQYRSIAQHCKDLSDCLPVMISPCIFGSKAIPVWESGVHKETDNITLSEHEQEWNEIMQAIMGVVDIVAFQDGHVDFHELEGFLTINKKLADKHGLQSWTNCETFDRDMPIKFLPIKWEKLLLKLQVAEKVGMDKAITFEFSHFMSPNSMYPSAHHLYNRYKQWLEDNQ
jgi:hypothetical protein